MRRVRLGVLHIATALAARPNVLYLLSDDLRVDLGFYGQPALTPHLDALAADGLVFDRACGAVRMFRLCLLDARRGVTSSLDARRGAAVYINPLGLVGTASSRCARRRARAS